MLSASQDGLPSPMLVVLTALVVASAVFALVLVLQTSWLSTRRLVRERMIAGPATVNQRSNPFLPALPRVEPLSERAQRLAAELERAGLAFTPVEFTAIRALCAVLTALAFVLMARFLSFGPALGL